jgi:hypothetical protein
LFLFQTFNLNQIGVRIAKWNNPHQITNTSQLSSAEIANKNVGKVEPLLRSTSFPLRCNHGRNRRRGVFRGASSNAISDDEDLKDIIQESLD